MPVGPWARPLAGPEGGAAAGVIRSGAFAPGRPAASVHPEFGLPTPYALGVWPEWPVLAQDTGAGGTHGSRLREVGSHPLTPCGAVALSLSGKANGGGVFF